VSFSPLQMKKNRPGTLLRVIARPQDQERLAAMIFAETSTLGLRFYPAERRVQERRLVEVETAWGVVRGKISSDGSLRPEYDDCRAIAQRAGVPLQEVLAAAAHAYFQKL
jgi:pyridinium-3,5-bisthiocarboxylic acid mononucleotide nickel chelatase